MTEPGRGARRWGRGAALLVGASIGIAALVALAALGYRELTYRVELWSESTCVGCHATLQRAMVQQWRGSAHFWAGVGCDACHGTDHDAIFGVDGEVSAVACAARCHPGALEGFRRSKHSHPKTGKKAELLAKYPDETGRCTFATGCHSVRKPFDDGSRGKCSVCHPSHGFSMAVTRDPATCVTCHSGSNNTEVAEYEKSIHGVLYRRVGLAGGGPTCATCHMPGGNHDDGFNTTDLIDAEVMVQPENRPLRFVRSMPRAVFEQKRAAMLKICTGCHGQKLARKALREADAFRKKGAFMLEEAATIVHRLYDEGLLDPMPEERTPNPTSKGLVLGAAQLFDREMSAAERIFYNMYMFTYSAAWRRAYHNLPGLIRWHENEMLKDDLIMLRAEAARLRSVARIRSEAASRSPP